MIHLADVAIVTSLLYSLVVLLFALGLILSKKGKNSTRPNVSVIIAARNEEDNISNILQDLVHQTYPPDHYEVIVANDGSSDATAEEVEKFSLEHDNFKHIHVTNIPSGYSPKKYALDCAVRHSQYEIILTTDADCRVSSRWIESMVSYFTQEVGFVIGFSQFGKKGAKQKILEHLQACDFMQLMGAAAGTCNLGYPLAASGQNLGYRRRAFQRVGGFKKVAHRVSGDDVLMLQLIRKYTNFKVVFAANPASFSVSQPQPSLRGLINQRKRWASNGSYQLHLNIPFFLYLLLVFLNSLVLLIGLPLAFLTGIGIEPLLLCLAAKASAESLFAMLNANAFNRFDLLRYFPVWFLVQIPYVVLMGTLGSLGNFSWKERKHSQIFNGFNQASQNKFWQRDKK